MNIITPSVYNDKLTWEVAHGELEQNIDNSEFFVLYPKVDEGHILSGPYEYTQQYFNFLLPEMRESLHKFLENKDEVHIFLGEDVGSLYAAYYTHLFGVKYSMTVRDIKFFGGKTLWAKTHPLVLNKLISNALKYAFEIELNGDHYLEVMKKQFPRIPREYVSITIPGYETDPIPPELASGPK